MNCIISKNKPTTNGYPRKSYKNKIYYHHRLVWILNNGEIPKGHDIHHKCGNKLCINIEHLECLDRKHHRGEHGLSGWAKIYSERIYCRLGHLLDGKNKEQRFCLKCKSKHQLEYLKRNREKVNAYKRSWRARKKEVC